MDKSEAIANQCPNQGGPAVYQARVLLNLMNDTIEYNDANECLIQGIFRSSNSDYSKKQEPSVIIIPNPASESAVIKLHGITDGMCHIEIHNMLNEIVFIGSFNCKERKKELNVSAFLPGVYSIKINANEQIERNQKLIIIK